MYSTEIERLLPVIREAGRIALKFFSEKNFQVRDKGHSDPVTEADYAVHNLLLTSLSEMFPADAVVSEETLGRSARLRMHRERKKAERIWIIDPIDGTREFVEGLPHFAISVGLVSEGASVLGFIHNPAKAFLIYGGPDTPVRIEGVPTAEKRNLTSFSSVKICLSRSETRKGFFNHLRKLLSIADAETIGSVAYKMGLVAAGQFDLLLSRKPKNEWDIAAGAALFSAMQYPLLDAKFMPITFNKKNLRSKGLVGGSQKAIDLYRNYLTDFATTSHKAR